jgi:hypothetical protein
MICCTIVASFNVSLSVELGACTDRPAVLGAAACGAASFSHLSAVPVVCAEYLDTVQLRRTALVR